MGITEERFTIGFPSFSEGLSLRAFEEGLRQTIQWYFPSFSEGLSLRAPKGQVELGGAGFPSFSEGLSLRVLHIKNVLEMFALFPSFSEGLSLRVIAAFFEV